MKNLFTPEKRISESFDDNIDKLGDTGNAFYILGWFKREAKREGWSKEQVDHVCSEATKGDYENLCNVITIHCS